MEYDVFIRPDGTICALYYDELKPLLECGDAEVKRASHVDPEMTDSGLKWFVDLAPSDGPKLGPFETRADAIDAEIQWLTENRM